MGFFDFIFGDGTDDIDDFDDLDGNEMSDPEFHDFLEANSILDDGPDDFLEDMMIGEVPVTGPIGPSGEEWSQEEADAFLDSIDATEFSGDALDGLSDEYIQADGELPESLEEHLRDEEEYIQGDGELPESLEEFDRDEEWFNDQLANDPEFRERYEQSLAEGGSIILDHSS